jgi:hypothetical protein
MLEMKYETSEKKMWSRHGDGCALFAAMEAWQTMENGSGTKIGSTLTYDITGQRRRVPSDPGVGITMV